MKKSIILLLSALLVCGFVLQKKEPQKCQRPNWKIEYSKEHKCYINTRHKLLLEEATDPIIKKNKNNVCYVVSGKWYINGEKIYSPQEIHIDHIVPYSYLAKQAGCDKAKKMYNDTINLQLLSADDNMKKSNNFCDDIEECYLQLQTCYSLKDKYKVNLDCNVIGYKYKIKQKDLLKK